MLIFFRVFSFLPHFSNSFLYRKNNTTVLKVIFCVESDYLIKNEFTQHYGTRSLNFLDYFSFTCSSSIVSRGSADHDISTINHQYFSPTVHVLQRTCTTDSNTFRRRRKVFGFSLVAFSGRTYDIVGAQLETLRRSVKPSADYKIQIIGFQ